MELNSVQSAQVQQHVVTQDCVTPTVQSADGADALAAVSVENLQDFLLVGWRVERGGLEHLVAAEIPALHTLNHAPATSGSVLKSSTYS